MELYELDVSSKTKKKNGLNYISWAAAWATLKEYDASAKFRIIENEFGRPWFDDGKSAWCKVYVQAFGLEHVQTLAVMDFRNKAIPADKVDSVEANKCCQRCLAKCIAVLTGIGLKIYEGEDIMPSKSSEFNKKKTVVNVDPALRAAQEQVVTLAKEITKAGVNRTLLYSVISKNNNGIKDPFKIDSIETCSVILEQMKELENK